MQAQPEKQEIDINQLAKSIYHSSNGEIFALTRALLTSHHCELSQYRYAISEMGEGDELFGVTKQTAIDICTKLSECTDLKVALIGHLDPDYDCLASKLLVRTILELNKIDSKIYLYQGEAQALAARAPIALNSILGSNRLTFDQIGSSDKVILLDAMDPHASNVRLDSSKTAYMILDNHLGEYNGEHPYKFAQHVALSTALFAVLIHYLNNTDSHNRGQFYNSQAFKDLAAWVVLAIYTDSGELMRANQFDAGVLKALLPYANPEILKEFRDNSLEAEATEIIKKLIGHRVSTNPGLSLFASSLPPIRTRDLGGIVADKIMNEDPTLSACLLTTAEVDRELDGVPQNAARGFLRVRASDSTAPDISNLAKAVFSPDSFGIRGKDVAGGVLMLPKSVHDKPMESPSMLMIHKFAMKALFPELAIE